MIPVAFANYLNLNKQIYDIILESVTTSMWQMLNKQ